MFIFPNLPVEISLMINEFNQTQLARENFAKVVQSINNKVQKTNDIETSRINMERSARMFSYATCGIPIPNDMLLEASHACSKAPILHSTQRFW
jgi:hypothetical protein